MSPTVTNIEVITHKGRRLSVRQIQHWIDTSSKDDMSARAPGKKELQLPSGALIAFDGSVFTLPDGDTFDPPST